METLHILKQMGSVETTLVIFIILNVFFVSKEGRSKTNEIKH